MRLSVHAPFLPAPALCRAQSIRLFRVDWRGSPVLYRAPPVWMTSKEVLLLHLAAWVIQAIHGIAVHLPEKEWADPTNCSASGNRRSHCESAGWRAQFDVLHPRRRADRPALPPASSRINRRPRCVEGRQKQASGGAACPCGWKRSR